MIRKTCIENYIVKKISIWNVRSFFYLFIWSFFCICKYYIQTPRRQNADVTIFLPTISCLVVSTAKKHSTRPWSESQAPVQYVQRRQCTYIIYENGKVSLGSSFDSPTTGHCDLLLRDKNTKARRFVRTGASLLSRSY